MLTDFDPMPFGKYKDKPMIEVPKNWPRRVLVLLQKKLHMLTLNIPCCLLQISFLFQII